MVVTAVVTILAVAEEVAQAGADLLHSCLDILSLPIHHGLSTVHLHLKVPNIVDHQGHITIRTAHHHMLEDHMVDPLRHTPLDQTSILENFSTSSVTDSVLTFPPRPRV